MAKKFGKFLLFTLVVGTAAVGAYLYLKEKNFIPCKCNCGCNDEEDEDKNRSYVSFEKEAPFEDIKEAVKETADGVEEFFDDVDKEITPEEESKTTE